MVLVKALIEREADEVDEHSYDSKLHRLLLHEDRQLMARADFTQQDDHLEIFSIDSVGMVSGRFCRNAERLQRNLQPGQLRRAPARDSRPARRAGKPRENERADDKGCSCQRSSRLNWAPHINFLLLIKLCPVSSAHRCPMMIVGQGTAKGHGPWAAISLEPHRQV